MEMKDYMGVPQAAKELGMAVQTIYNAIRAKKVLYREVPKGIQGKKILIPVKEVERLKMERVL